MLSMMISVPRVAPTLSIERGRGEIHGQAVPSLLVQMARSQPAAAETARE